MAVTRRHVLIRASVANRSYTPHPALPQGQRKEVSGVIESYPGSTAIRTPHNARLA
jgi:hypothetical protein